MSDAAPSPEDERPNLTVAEYARLLRVSEKTVRRYIKRGVIRKCQPGGPNCRVSIPADALAARSGPGGGQTLPVTSPSQPPPPPAAEEPPPPAAEKLPGRPPAWKRRAGLA